jgi:hypothetical protein
MPNKIIKLTFMSCITITILTSIYYENTMLAVRGVVILTALYLLSMKNKKRNM